MKMHFKFQELLVETKNIPVDVAQKLLTYHMIPVSVVREELGVAITASLNSGYRSREWELSKGRSGTSQHVFIGKGAVDWTCSNFRTNKQKFLELLVEHTDYTRFAVYNNFIHCDYKKTPSNKKEVYTSTANSIWTLKKTI